MRKHQIENTFKVLYIIDLICEIVLNSGLDLSLLAKPTPGSVKPERGSLVANARGSTEIISDKMCMDGLLG